MNRDDAHAIAIGISKYAHVRPLPEVQDAEDVAAVLTSPGQGAYLPGNVHLLGEEKATRDRIVETMGLVAAQAREASTVFVYFSGHGGSATHEGRDDCYLIPIDGVWDRADDLERTAISGRWLSEWLRKLPARRVTVVLDCCRAAGLAEPRHGRPIALEPELSPGLLSPFGSGRGRAVLAASRADGYAYVRPGDRNGVFTRHLLDGLRGAAGGAGGVIRVCELFHYVQQKVVAEERAQRPVFKAELEEDYPVALYRGGETPPLVLSPPSDSFGYDAFVSYRRSEPADRQWVESVLVPRLEGYGLRLCLDPRDFRLGAVRIREMERAVVESRYTVAVLSPAYLDGAFQDFETVLAQHQAIETRAPRFIPLLRRDCRPRLSIRTTEWLDVSEDASVEAGLQRLAQRLREPPHPTLSAP